MVCVCRKSTHPHPYTHTPTHIRSHTRTHTHTQKRNETAMVIQTSSVAPASITFKTETKQDHMITPFEKPEVLDMSYKGDLNDNSSLKVRGHELHQRSHESYPICLVLIDNNSVVTSNNNKFTFYIILYIFYISY